MKSRKASLIALLMILALMLSACGSVAGKGKKSASSDSKNNTVSVTKSKNADDSSEASGNKSDAGKESSGANGAADNGNSVDSNVSPSDTGNSGSQAGNSGDSGNSPASSSEEEGENGYSLEYELQYYWYDWEDGRYTCYPTYIARNGEYIQDNDFFPSMPFSYVWVEKTKWGSEWCTLSLSFLVDGGEINVDCLYEKINGTHDDDIDSYTYGEAASANGAFEPGPYTISGCGTDTMNIVSEYEHGKHTHYVLKLVRDSRNMQ